MPRVLYCERTCPPLEPPFPLPPAPQATPLTAPRPHVDPDDPNSPTSPLPLDPNHQQLYFDSDDSYCPSSPEFDAISDTEDYGYGGFDPYVENVTRYADIALAHYNSQDKHQIKYQLMKDIVSCIIRYDGAYHHLNFTAKSTLENSKEEFFFAELRFDCDIQDWVPVSLVALEENERVGGFSELPFGVVDPRHCFGCGDRVKHPPDGSLYEAGHYLVENCFFHRYIEVLPAPQPGDMQN